MEVGEYFKTDRCVKTRFVMFPWLFNVFIDGVMKEVEMGIGRFEVRFVRGVE